ncbi:MAG: T9SS type A sorting domain-containing protein [Bacteroidota bacterium]
MKKKYIVIFLIVFLSLNIKAQFNENAPWIQNQQLSKTLSKNTLQDLSKSFNDYFKNRDWEAKGSGFKPFKRWENHWKYYTLKDGSIAPPAMLWKSWEQKKEIANKSNNVSNWQSLGPYTTNVKTGQGRINTFIVDPNNPNTFYVGAPSGGIWKSTDAGINWVPLSDHIPQIGVSGIAIDPNNSNIIYIVTGDDDARDTYSVGVMKSTDGGNTWNKTGLTFNTVNASANEIFIHPNDSNILWVATNEGFYKSIDAGANWQRKLSGNIRDIKLKPGNPNIVYAVTSSTFWKSINAGDTFVQISSNLPDPTIDHPSRFTIGVSPANPEIVYVLSAQSDNSFQGLYKSSDGGETFTKTLETDDIFVSKQAWYDMALTVSPNDENLVFVGVLDIWKSSDGGDNFTQINHWWNPTEPSYTHADIHFLRYFNNKLYAGTDGGIYQSENNGSSFKDLTETLNISQYYKISTAKHSITNIVGGLQDNGGFAFSNNIWHRYHGGDGMDCAIDPNNQEIYYGFMQFGSNLNVTYNGGKTEGITIAEAPDDEVSGTSDRGGNWVTPLISNKDGILYAGYEKLYKLNNNTWEAVSDNIFGGDLDNIEISSTNNDLIYVSRDQFLYKSTDGGVTFTKLTFSFPNIISSIEINNNNNDLVYVTIGSFFNNGIYKSTDSGENFESISYNLPSEPKLVIKHQNQSLDNDLFVGTGLGVYHINDKMNEWEVFSTNLPNVPIKDLEINVEEKTITVGTYGRGVWQSPIEVTLANNDISLIEIISNNSVQCEGVTPKIIVKNNGLNIINTVTINYSIDNENFNHQFVGDIPSGDHKEIILPTNNSVTFGTHNLSINTTIDNDTFAENNSSSVSFTVNNSSIGQYINTFDINEDDWLVQTIGNSTDLWQKGKPTTTKFNSIVETGYVTNLSSNYTDETVSYLISPCYNLTQIENPVLKFDMVFDIEKDWDVLYMEYTIDNGKSWEILGNANDPNWYNSSFIDPQRPITVGKQWTGTDTTLKEYSYDLVALQNESNIIFRFVFATDQAANQEGAVIDNFTIDGTIILAVENYDQNAFNIYPNPSNGTFNIQRNGNEEMQISIYDITGKIIYKKNEIIDNSYELKLNRVEKGIYFLKINVGNTQVAKRLIIK